MAGDREKCLNVGCNGYVPKPIDRKEFLATVAKQLHSASGPSVSSESTAPTLSQELVTSDPEIMEEFFRWLAEQIEVLEGVTRDPDPKVAEWTAHAVKGVAGSLGFDAVFNAATQVVNEARGAARAVTLVELTRALISVAEELCHEHSS